VLLAFELADAAAAEDLDADEAAAEAAVPVAVEEEAAAEEDAA
jgi:hypothetical protein